MRNYMKKISLSVLLGLWLHGIAKTQTTTSHALHQTLNQSYTNAHHTQTTVTSDSLAQWLDISHIATMKCNELNQYQINILAAYYINEHRKKNNLPQVHPDRSLTHINEKIAKTHTGGHTKFLQETVSKKGWQKETWELLSHGFQDRTIERFINQLLTSPTHLQAVNDPSYTTCSLVLIRKERTRATAQVFLSK